MPSQVVTKRRVKRRQQRHRLVSKNAKRKVRSVRKHRKTAKKVMRGGGDIQVTIRGFYDIIPKGIKDKINIPIFIVVQKHNTPKDVIYVFFNKNITNEDAMLILKLLLGMSIEDTFELNPPLGFEPQDDSTENIEDSPDDIHSKFVKISGIFGYNIETGTIKVDIDENGISDLDKSIDKKHKIISGKIVVTNGTGIIENFNESKKQVQEKVLPELYKSYYFLATTGDLRSTDIENGGLIKTPERRVESGITSGFLDGIYHLVSYKHTVKAFFVDNVLNYGSNEKYYFHKKWWEIDEKIREVKAEAARRLSLSLGDKRD